MIRRTVPTALVAVAVGITALFASPALEAQEIDLETSVAMALSSNLGLESEMLELKQKKLIADTWWNRFYPGISARATMARPNKEPTSPGSPFPGSPSVPAAPRWNLSTGLDMQLNLSMQMVPGVNLARLNYDNGRITLEDARRQVERDTTKQFYSLLLLKEQIRLARQQIDTAGRRYEQARINYENGLVDEYSRLSAQVAWENQKPRLTGLEVQYQQALLAFRNNLGVPLTRPLEPVGTIDPPSLTMQLQDVTRELLERRLDLRQLEYLDQILQQQYNLTDAGRAPTLSFGWSVDPAFSGDPWKDDLFDGDRWDQRSGAFTITVRQPLDPWLPFSQLRNELADVRKQQQQNAIRRNQAVTGAEIEVRSLIRAIRAAEETVDALDFNIELARRAYELAEIGYNNGLRDLLEVQNAEVELQSARFELLKQRKQIMDNLLDLQYALNVSIDEIAIDEIAKEQQ
jgi:outer membrane protein TolC